MGDFSDILREGIEILDELTDQGGLQDSVRHYRFASQSLTGAPTFSPSGGTLRKAFVEYVSKDIRTTGGKEVRCQAWVLFPRPVLIGPKDKIVLPNGKTGPILTEEGFVDSLTHESYYKEIYLG